MEATLNLELLFKNAAGSSKKINVRQPKEEITSEVAQATLAAIVDANIFQTEDGDPYAEAVGARYVTRTVEDIFSAE